MTFRHPLWYPAAVLLSVANIVAVYFAAVPAEPLHASAHATLAVLFGVWARHLHQQRQPALGPGTDTLAMDVDDLRQELAETQERLDFAERMLAQGARREPEPRERDDLH